MDASQEQTVLRAIAASALPGFPLADRQAAFSILQDLKKLPTRMDLAIRWLQQPIHMFQQHDVTVPAKLLALEIVDQFLVHGEYATITADARHQLRSSILWISRVEKQRVLSRKIAAILAGLILRDFPQRWTELPNDLFAPQPPGLWYCAGGGGTEIVLEAIKSVAEDCLDADFNSKISSTRRSDVLKGLLELSTALLLPLVYQLLQTGLVELQQSKRNLHAMHTFLLSEQRTIHNLRPDTETEPYRRETATYDESSTLLTDALVMLEKLIVMLPTDVMFRSEHNFIAAFLHLLREPVLQVPALKCIEALAGKGKMSMEEWMRLLTDLPVAINEANQIYQSQEEEYQTTKRRATTANNDNASSATHDPLVAQYEYHRLLSQVFAVVVTSQTGLITGSKHILSGEGQKFDTLRAFLHFASTMLEHPSGRVLSTQLNLWTNLMRDSQIVKTNLVRPLCAKILACCMERMVLVNWDDVENDEHPQAAILLASFEDEEEYISWKVDFRSRCSTLFRVIGETAPDEAAQALNGRVQHKLSVHGSGAPMNHRDPTNNQLTERSDAIRELEALHNPMENLLAGIPEWAFIDVAATTTTTTTNNYPKRPKDANERKRDEIRAVVQSCAANMARLVVGWQPSFVWLKFRHAQLLECLRYVWKYDSSTILDAVNTLLRYLSLSDEWSSSGPSSTNQISPEMVALKKKSGAALVNVANAVPRQLVPWLSQLTEVARTLLSSDGLIPLNQTNVFEFLTCIAITVENPSEKANFISQMLADSIATLESAEIRKAVSSSGELLAALGVSQVAERPELVTDPPHVEITLSLHSRLFNPLNRILSVGRRCQAEARTRTVLAGFPIDKAPKFGEPGLPTFPPDEGPISIQDLALSDPFVLLWNRILPIVLQLYESICAIWQPETQAALFQSKVQCYALAISDEELFLAIMTKSRAGVYSEDGGTAGSIVSGISKKDLDLRPKWSAMLSELRNTCYQLFALLAAQRVLYSPELAPMYPRIVSVIANPVHLKCMEHRHASLFLKTVVDYLLLTCPASLYASHLGPILQPVFDSMRERLAVSWAPAPESIVRSSSALRSATLGDVQEVFRQDESAFLQWYYRHGGLFVGDLDEGKSETVVEKTRIEMTRTFCDVLQSALALKGDWALTLANIAKEESGDPSTRPTNGKLQKDGAVNANGTPKLAHQEAVDARKLLRINLLGRFLFLDNPAIASCLLQTFINMLSFPDAYTCRRILMLCHRLVEYVAWAPSYSEYLGQQMLTRAILNLVTEPKWMVGVEWGMINLVRDIYCRLVLGQWLQFGGQGTANQQPNSNGLFEQSKTVNEPLQGGGILIKPSNLPREVFASLPGVGIDGVIKMESALREKRSAKDQKDIIKDVLLIASDQWSNNDNLQQQDQFSKANLEESLLHTKILRKAVQDIPETLVINSKNHAAAHTLTNEGPPVLQF